MAHKPRVTSLDVARLAKVSQSAVSRTFTPGASVASETRRRVMEAAKQLGYRPNAMARSLITQRSRMIGLVVAYLENSFYPRVIETLSRRLQREGYHVLLFLTDVGDADEVLQEILQYQVAGILMASATLSTALAHECADAGIPVVLFNRYVPGSPTNSVTSDNRAGGRKVAEFLLAGGHERIAYIAGDPDASTNQDREAGFLEALEARGETCWARAVGGYSYEGAAAATHELFGGSQQPDAVFVANDHMAFAVMDTLRYELGLAVPDTVSVVGYDDVPQAAWPSYSLTTVEQRGTAMVDAAVDVLLGQFGNEYLIRNSVVVPGDLVVRGSARRPKKHEGRRGIVA